MIRFQLIYFLKLPLIVKVLMVLGILSGIMSLALGGLLGCRLTHLNHGKNLALGTTDIGDMT